MATLEDRILGEKLQYYCSSSSEDEGDEDDDKDLQNKNSDLNLESKSQPDFNSWEGTSANTGPKGVLKDWQRFKQLEAEQRKEQEKEKIELAKKLALTCRSHLDDEKEKQQEEDVDKLIDDEILQKYIINRMEEMMKNTSKKKLFGTVLKLESGDDFLQAIDKEEKNVTVIIHLYDDKICGCETMNGCLISLAEENPEVKFCYINASIAGLSTKFKVDGLPALLVYKSGQMVGNFVRITDELGEDFFAADLESFLIEHGILLDKTMVASVIRDKQAKEEENSDSD